MPRKGNASRNFSSSSSSRSLSSLSSSTSSSSRSQDTSRNSKRKASNQDAQEEARSEEEDKNPSDLEESESDSDETDKDKVRKHFRACIQSSESVSSSLVINGNDPTDILTKLHRHNVTADDFESLPLNAKLQLLFRLGVENQVTRNTNIIRPLILFLRVPHYISLFNAMLLGSTSNDPSLAWR
jgi:hypothetical protein